MLFDGFIFVRFRRHPACRTDKVRYACALMFATCPIPSMLQFPSGWLMLVSLRLVPLPVLSMPGKRGTELVLVQCFCTASAWSSLAQHLPRSVLDSNGRRIPFPQSELSYLVPPAGVSLNSLAALGYEQATQL